MDFITANLSSVHKKNEFCCEKELLDNYLYKQANQDIKRKLSACFVLADNNSNLIKGYYTLSNSSIPSILIPEEVKKQLPNSYTSIPTTLLGRLAIDKNFKGNGIGKILLVDALKRCYEISKTIGSFAVIVDPLDKEAQTFYAKYGFIKLPDSGKMFLPMKTIQQLFEK
ncbi:MAG: GNAT family N-acetyltransferase [Bacteroidetes bacterium HGW-Bacteroidetes-3]|jgi:predicted GNAT family N-acyltransferase|nr:MAG: GNAT family N-acetyltransferase [Bacteroidetes bacterium HGW-Bacteroidetes-3]